MIRRRDVLGYGLYALTATGCAHSSQQAIVSCAIHPAIGIARVGNSPDEWFLGPETPGATGLSGAFKDAGGRIRRQGVRFRIFGLDAAGSVVREITADEADITWTVELANTKAAWHRFQSALDLPIAEQDLKPSSEASGTLRNQRYSGVERARLAIRPIPRSLSERNKRAEFSDGQFLGEQVTLGEIRTDQDARLIVLGGFGVSRSVPAGTPPSDYANNDGWHDDVSDGPVDAVVRIGGRSLPVVGAWVVVGPPAYAAGISPVVTLYDLIYSISVPHVERRVSFTREIYPILERFSRHQWVNAGFARDFGHASAHDFLAPQMLRQLADAGSRYESTRQEIFRRFRDPSYSVRDASGWPPYNGDSVAGAHEFMAMLPHQHDALRRWAMGDFDADQSPDGPRFASNVEEIPIAELPAALDRAQLDAASGGPFHPGIEVGWVIRRPSLYASPFRFKRRIGGERDYGSNLTSAIALADDGPLHALSPGDLTRWLSVPWQTDTVNCDAGSGNDPYLPTFWPALAPNNVLTEDQYRELVSAQSEEERRRVLAPEQRRRWLRGSQADKSDMNSDFVANWHRMGVIAERPGPVSGPARVWVETERSLPEAAE